MAFQIAFGFATEPYKVGSDVLNGIGEVGDIYGARWHACEDKLGEKRVDILTGFE